MKYKIGDILITNSEKNNCIPKGEEVEVIDIILDNYVIKDCRNEQWFLKEEDVYKKREITKKKMLNIFKRGK